MIAFFVQYTGCFFIPTGALAALWMLRRKILALPTFRVFMEVALWGALLGIITAFLEKVGIIRQCDGSPAWITIPLGVAAIWVAVWYHYQPRALRQRIIIYALCGVILLLCGDGMHIALMMWFA